MTVGPARQGRSGRAAAALRVAAWSAAITVAVPGGYLLIGVMALAAVPDPVTATMAAGTVVAVVVITARRLRPGRFAYAPPPRLWEKTGVRAFVSSALAALLLAFLAGQVAAAVLYGEYGSSGFDRHEQAVQSSGPGMALLLSLLVAPVAEEALFRGLLYPLLRRRAGLMVSMTVTALLFALMHGNLVQAAATLPLGLVLALIAERTRGIGAVVVAHAGYNLAVTLVPPAMIQPLTPAPCVIFLLAAASCGVVRLAGLVQATCGDVAGCRA